MAEFVGGVFGECFAAAGGVQGCADETRQPAQDVEQDLLLLPGGHFVHFDHERHVAVAGCSALPLEEARLISAVLLESMG